MGRTGRWVIGRGTRSARHQSLRSRKVPRGVPPSPSRLLALMPPRPIATGMARGPAVSHPRVGWPGFGRTKSVEIGAFSIALALFIHSSKVLALLSPNGLLRAIAPGDYPERPDSMPNSRKILIVDDDA